MNRGDPFSEQTSGGSSFWKARELARRRKGDAGNVRVAGRLRAETTMTLNWIAKELNMGAAGSLANLLRKKK